MFVTARWIHNNDIIVRSTEFRGEKVLLILHFIHRVHWFFFFLWRGMKNTVRVLRGKQQRTTTLCVEVVKKQPDELKQTKRSTRPNICRKYNVNYLHTQYYHICIYNMNVLYSCMSAFSIKSYGFWTKLVLLFLGGWGKVLHPSACSWSASQ